jgi:hypothetical protein
VVVSVPFLAEEEEAVHPDRWVPLAEGERKAAVPVREFARWAAGWLLELGRIVSVRPSFIFLFLFFFSFSIFLFLS